ncbi:hypothetical protein tb265_04470 [Gemmatimonadetes bacterium T265]|nr:hypothetical protein tb265_04470 [Gemmatimonadetes bacterium T265]
MPPSSHYAAEIAPADRYGGARAGVRGPSWPLDYDASPAPFVMSDHIRDRIQRKLATLRDERLYQVLDYVEFLELRYGQPAANPTPVNPLQRFADGIEDRLRAGGVAASTVSEAMGFLNKAVGVLNDVATAGRTVATDIATAAQRMTEPATGSAPGTASAQGAGTSGPAAPPAPGAGAPPGRPATDPTDMPSYPSPS